MKTKLNLKPGQRGTKRLCEKYGDSLVRVRYRYDEIRKKRYKTVELIIEEKDWEPDEPSVNTGEIRNAETKLVGVRIGPGESVLQQKARKAGGIWNRRIGLWELEYEKALRIGLKDRIEKILPRQERGTG